MASTYSTNFGIEKIGSGEQSGTWGTTTNHNLDIVDRIGAFKSVALSDASTATLTVRAGSPSSGSSNLQDGMFRVIKFTGTLSQQCTITVSPSTTTSYFHIQNATTGGFSIVMKQGSGAATVTVPNGFTKHIYCDASDEVIALSDILALGTLTATTSILKPTTTNGDLTLQGNGTGDVILDADLIKIGSGSEDGVITSNGAYDLILETNSGTNSSKVKITDAANGDITLDTNGTGKVAVGSGSASGKITSNGAHDLVIDTNSGTNAGTITLTDGSNGDITFATNGTGAVVFSDDVVSRPQLKDYAETLYANGTKTSAFDLDLTNGNVQSFTVGSGTFNVGITNSLSSHSNSITVIITNGGAGTVSFVSGTNAGGGNAVKFAGGTAPTLTSSGTDVLTFTTFDGGTNFFGFAAGLAMA